VDYSFQANADACVQILHIIYAMCPSFALLERFLLSNVATDSPGKNFIGHVAHCNGELTSRMFVFDLLQ